MYFPKPAVNENDLAIIERGDTAEHSISAGQYVSWKGKLGKAVSAILQGATLDDSLFSYDENGALNKFIGFIDEQSITVVSAPDLPFTYTATEDCWIHINTACRDGQGWAVYLGTSTAGLLIFESYGGNSVAVEATDTIPLKKGQTIYVRANNSKPAYSSYRVYKMIR